MIYLQCDLPVSPHRTHHIHHDIHDAYICQIFESLKKRKFVKSPTFLRLKTCFLSQWNPGNLESKIPANTLSDALRHLKKKIGLRRPRGQTRPISCCCLCSLFRRGHHCGNKLFPFSFSAILTEEPLADNIYYPPPSRPGSQLSHVNHDRNHACTSNPTWGDNFESCFKAQDSMLERLF